MVSKTWFFYFCAAFLLTGQNVSAAWSKNLHFQRAQKFFYESRKKEQQNSSNALPLKSSPSSSKFKLVFNVIKPPAVYFSVMWNSFQKSPSPSPSSSSTSTNIQGFSLGASIPVYSHFRYSHAEFQFSGNIRKVESWGHVQGLHKESISLFRLSKTLFEAFFGMGLGYGYGDLISSKQRFFAPWALGFQWGQIFKNRSVFYRFSLGISGHVYFSSRNDLQGPFAYLDVGYKL